MIAGPQLAFGSGLPPWLHTKLTKREAMQRLLADTSPVSGLFLVRMQIRAVRRVGVDNCVARVCASASVCACVCVYVRVCMFVCLYVNGHVCTRVVVGACCTRLW